jgi:hypothetical protein
MSAPYRQIQATVAGILYLRNRLAGEVAHVRAELAQRTVALSRAVRNGDARADLERDVEVCRAEIERAERDLALAERDADAAKSCLLAAHEAMRDSARVGLRERIFELTLALRAESEADDALHSRSITAP